MKIYLLSTFIFCLPPIAVLIYIDVICGRMTDKTLRNQEGAESENI